MNTLKLQIKQALGHIVCVQLQITGIVGFLCPDEEMKKVARVFRSPGMMEATKKVFLKVDITPSFPGSKAFKRSAKHWQRYTDTLTAKFERAMS